MSDDYLDDPSRRLIQRIRSDVDSAACWMSSQPPPVDGTPAAGAKTSLRRALNDLDIILGSDEEEDDDDGFEPLRSRRRRRRGRN